MLELLNSTFPDLAAMTPDEARAAADARIRPAPNLDDVARTEDHTLATAHGPLRVREYHPHAPEQGSPVTVYAHGGGFLHGSIESHDGFCRRWASQTGMRVVSVDYRLAPEHRPADAADDVAVAARWAATTTPHGNVVIAGDSAGATAALGAALRLRSDAGVHTTALVAAYPMLDPTCSSESHRTRATGFFVTHRQLRYYWSVALADRIPAPEDTPWLGDDLEGLPATIVVSAGLDVLTDETRAFAARLRGAGVPTTLRHFPDQFHGFLTMAGYPPGEAAREVLFSDLRALVPTLTDSE